MASNVAIDSGQMDSPLSLLSSPSQASDASSVATDRVFFGPVRSPEKRFARRAGSAPFRTPVRRSTRLSSAMVPPPIFPQHRAALTSSREGTPDEDSLVDEPSVMLASRVLSASGNPSPPPSPPLPSEAGPSTFMDVQLLDISNSPQPQATPIETPTGPLIPIDDVPEPSAAPAPIISRATTPTPAHIDVANTSQPDLITFDSFSASRDTDGPTTSEPQYQESLPARLTASTIDDLLSMSPRPIISATQEDIPDSTLAEPQSDATAPEDEEEVENSLVIEVDSPTLPTLLANSPPPEAGRVEDSESTAEHVQGSTPQLRRSSRPRKSRSSLPQTVATPPQPSTSSIEVVDESSGTTPTPASQDAQPSPARKRKLKPTPRLGSNILDGTADVSTPRRVPRTDLTRRDLGSLSPMSAAVLKQLLPAAAPGDSVSRSTTPQPQTSEPAGPSEPAAPPSTPPNQAANLVFPKVGSQVDGTATEIQRPRSPLRPFPMSPSKLDDIARTPARRVPIAQAIAEGTYSAQKLPALFGAPRPTAAPGSPVFKRLALDDPTRSPAKRVPISEAVIIPPYSPNKGKEVVRPSSPVRPVPRERERSGSAEPRPLLGRKERGASAEPTTRPPALGRRPFFQKPASSDGITSSSASTKPRTALPFPLVQSQRLHPSIPEADEPGPSVVRPSTATAGTSSQRAQPTASPAKGVSSLRQPSAGAGSKIPRIGAKPYARPKAAGKPEGSSSKLPTPAKSRPASKPLRIVTVGSSSSSDEGTTSNPPASRPLRQQLAAPPQREPSAATGLKRKREAEASTSKATAPAAQSVIVMRKVLPGMFNKGESATSGSSAEQVTTRPPVVASPAKPVGPIKARSAANWKRPQPAGESAPPSSPPLPSVQTALSATVAEPGPPLQSTPESAPAAAAEPPKEVVEPSPAKISQETVSAPESTAQPHPSGKTPPVAPDAGPSTEATVARDHPERQHRRSTRSKRGQERAPTTDVFGTVAPPAAGSSTRTSHHRRKPGPFPSETAGPFAGMSALALKTLTTANTLKNQQQVAVLKTEVVRKEGPRPDSPTTKVRTALDRQREERVQQRKERAERRARRSAGDETGEGLGIGVNEAGDASFMSVDHDPEDAPGRHRRGPGDEEDYETPPRPERPAKRARFEGAETDAEKEKEAAEKRVKWDKGLHTTVYLDDSPPKPKRAHQAVPTQKSCLAAAAKALRLDMLGNVLNAELPVRGLVRENVVVKKFVFDDDAEPEVASPAPAKSTRSKSKKAKATS